MKHGIRLGRGGASKAVALAALSLSVAVLASCADVLTTAPATADPEIRLVQKTGNLWEMGYWACTSTSWADGSSHMWCTFYENPNSGVPALPPFPPDPTEPLTDTPSCMDYGACGDLSGPSAGTVPPDQAPPGIDPSIWGLLNEAEKRYCNLNHQLCAQSLAIAAHASLRVKELAKTECQCDEPNMHNNHWDAVRHAYWQAILRKNTGVINAIAWANTHEDYPGNPRTEVCMDEYNNNVGRTIAANNPNASDSQILNLVLLATLKNEPYSC